MRFVVLGAGVIGCYVGARLAAAGQAVTLVGRPRLTEAMALQGLTVSDLDGYRAHVAPQQLRLANSLAAGWPAAPDTEPTVVLLCVKGGATASAARELAACCPAGTVVLSLQNGVENVARIKAEAPQLVALAGMVPYNVVMPGPTQVHRATTGTLRLARHPVTEAMLPLMAAAGLPTALSDDMRAVQWGKLLLNLNNPINALSGLPLREQLLQRDYRRVLAALQLEALAALKAAGIVPARVASAPPRTPSTCDSSTSRARNLAAAKSTPSTSSPPTRSRCMVTSVRMTCSAREKARVRSAAVRKFDHRRQSLRSMRTACSSAA
jgi:2-dehydropantoate 2-reductase